MLKAILADDNKLVLERFARMADWEAHGFSLACLAADGKQAWDAYEAHRPQLVITDVQMPRMDGIELARRVREADPGAVILFLTSYEEFAYVKSALGLGVRGYLLKHETEREQLAEALDDAREEIGRRRRRDRYGAESPLFSLIRDVLDGGFPEGALREYEASLPGAYDFLILEQDAPHPALMDAFGLAQAPVSEGALKAACYRASPSLSAVVRVDGTRHVAIARAEGGGDAAGLARGLTRALGAQFRETFSALVVAEGEPILACAAQYERAAASGGALSQMRFHPRASVTRAGVEPACIEPACPSACIAPAGDEPVCPPAGAPAGAEPACPPAGAEPAGDSAYPPAGAAPAGASACPPACIAPVDVAPGIARFEGLAAAGRHAEALHLLDDMFLSVIERRDGDALDALCRFAAQCLLRHHGKAVDPRAGRVFAAFRAPDRECWHDAGGIHAWARRKFAELFRCLPAGALPQYSEGVRAAIDHVHRNYQDPGLSLESVAEALRTNPARLNARIKKETGETAWKLIMKVRMDKARELLAEGRLKVTEIGAMTGYRDVSYFSKAFREAHGVSPMEYRRASASASAAAASPAPGNSPSGSPT